MCMQLHVQRMHQKCVCCCAKKQPHMPKLQVGLLCVLVGQRPIRPRPPVRTGRAMGHGGQKTAQGNSLSYGKASMQGACSRCMRCDACIALKMAPHAKCLRAWQEGEGRSAGIRADATNCVSLIGWDSSPCKRRAWAIMQQGGWAEATTCSLQSRVAKKQQ